MSATNIVLIVTITENDIVHLVDDTNLGNALGEDPVDPVVALNLTKNHASQLLAAIQENAEETIIQFLDKNARRPNAAWAGD